MKDSLKAIISIALIIVITLICCIFFIKPKVFNFKTTKEYEYIQNNRKDIEKIIIRSSNQLGEYCYKLDVKRGDDILNITFSNIEDCNQKPELLIEKDDINIYTYCIKDVKINVNGKLFDLEKYIRKNKNSIENIIAFLPFKAYKIIDHHTVYDGEKFETAKDSTIKLVKCHTTDGNENVYIGDVRMNVKSNFCKDNNYTFIRTYFIKDIEYDSFNDYKVKLKNVNGIEAEIIINNWKLVYLEENKTYEFEFMLNDNVKTIDDNTKFIFDNRTIVDIRETTKDINNQINEKIK